MTNKIKNILKENKIIIFLFFVFIFLIYFFGIRPSQIREYCSNYITNDIGEPSQYSVKVAKVSDDQYKSCLRQNGIEN